MQIPHSKIASAMKQDAGSCVQLIRDENERNTNNTSNLAPLWYVAAIVLSFISSCALSFSHAETGELAMPYTFTVSEWLFLGVSFYLFRHILVTNRKRPRLPVIIVSLFIGISLFLGMLLTGPYDLHVSYISLWENITVGQNNRAIVYLVIAAALFGFLAFAYAAVAWLYDMLDNIKMRNSNFSSGRHDVRLFGKVPNAVAIPLIMFLCWLPYIVIFGPHATMTCDTARSLGQFYGTDGLSLDTHFPYFTTLLYAVINEIGAAIDPYGTTNMLLMVLMQVALGMFLLTQTTLWVSRIGAPKWAVYTTLAFFSLFPLIPIYMTHSARDTVHALFVGTFVIQILLACMKSSDMIPKGWFYSPVAIALCGLLVSLTRNNGIFIVAAALFVYIILFRDKKVLAAGIATCLLFASWQYVLIPSLGIKFDGYKEAMSMPIQVIGSVLDKTSDEVLGEELIARVDNNFNADHETVRQAYLPPLSDPIKHELAKCDTVGESLSLAKTSVLLAQKAPLAAASGALATTYPSWYPFCYGTYHNEDTPYVPGQDHWSTMTWWQGNEHRVDHIKAIGEYTQMVKIFHVLPGFGTLYHAGVYTWLVVLMMGYAFYRKSARKITTATMVSLIMLILVCIAAPCASVRYALPFVFALPAILIVPLLANKCKFLNTSTTQRNSNEETLPTEKAASCQENSSSVSQEREKRTRRNSTQTR